MQDQFQPQKRKKSKILIWFFILFFIGFFSFFFLKTSFTVSQITNTNTAQISPFEDYLPKLPDDDPNRLNILLLGIRGGDNVEEGNLLADTIILLSVDKESGKSALISIPRDLYVRIWGSGESKKINSAYAYGGINYAKKTVSLVTGLYVDYGISINFDGFKDIVDTLGGITVYLDEPFEESFQWAKEGKEENEYWFIKEFPIDENQSSTTTASTTQRWVFHVPAGRNYLNGENALYYARSRYSTNDFDRMHRQQRILIALKEKILSLGVLANPLKIYSLLDILGNNVKMDISLEEIKNLIELSSDLDTQDIIKITFEASEGGLLYDDFINDEYVLLPEGDSFDQIIEECQNVFK